MKKTKVLLIKNTDTGEEVTRKFLTSAHEFVKDSIDYYALAYRIRTHGKYISGPIEIKQIEQV